MVFACKAAFFAFLNQTVLEPVSPLAPADYQVLFIDEASDHSNPMAQSSAHTFNLVGRAFEGDNLVDQNFPPVRASMNSWTYPQDTASIAGGLGIPAIGFADASSAYLNLDHYPTFMRTIPSTKFRAAISFLVSFGYTRVDDATCDSQKGRDTFTSISEELKVAGIAVYQVLWPVGEHFGWPLCFGSRRENGVEFGHNCTGPEPEKQMLLRQKSQYEHNVRFMKENNAHAHLYFLASDCPIFDVLSYLGLHGLAGGGHMYLGEDIIAPYETQYIPYLRIVAAYPKVATAGKSYGYVSPYAFTRPMDGYVAVRTKISPRMANLWAWMQKLREFQNGFLEEYIRNAMASVVDNAGTDGMTAIWTEPEGLIWRGGTPYPYYIFDATFVILRSINSLLLSKGQSFTQEDMLNAMLDQDFEGVTGRVRFNKTTRERITVIEMVQYQIGHIGSDTDKMFAENFTMAEPAAARRLGGEGNFGDAGRRLRMPRFHFSGGLTEGASVEGRKLTRACAPPVPGDATAVGAYLACLKNNCEDAADSVVSSLTSGSVSGCAFGFAAAQQDCNYDLSTLSSSLPPGTPLWKLCAEQCNCEDGRVTGEARRTNSNPTCPFNLAACDLHSIGVPLPFARYFENTSVVVGQYESDLTLYKDKVRFYDGRTADNPPPNLDLPCAEGQKYDAVSGVCTNCPAGFYTNTLSRKTCDPCPTGTYSDQVQTSQCTACTWGSFSDAVGSTTCKNCSAGRFTDEPLKSECLSCRAGTYAEEAAKKCEFCEPGKYQSTPEQSSCISCDSFIRGSISDTASTNSSACLCPSGTYWRPTVGCTACVDGLRCTGGNDYPLQEPGFNVFIADSPTRDYEVFECTESDWCPEGVVSTCSAKRSGRSCAKIEGDACPFYVYTFMPLIFLTALYAIYRVAEHSTYGRVTSVVIMAGNISIAMVAMQAVNVYMNFFTPLPEELQWIREFTQVFMLQFNMVFPECSYGQSFIARYSVSIWPPLFIVASFCVLHSMTTSLHFATKRVPLMKLDPTINTAGMVIQVMYVMQCKDAFAYFNSKENPSGKDTLVSFPDVIFASDEHFGFGPVLITIYLWAAYVIGTYSVFVWVVVNARKKVHNKRFTARFRFVLARWRPECWFWGLLMLARNLGIALIPICVRTDRVFQTIVFIMLLMIHAIAEARFLPWRATINAVFEIVISLLLTLLMVGGLIFDSSTSGTEASPEEKAMAMCMAILFGCVWALILTSVFIAIRWGSDKHKAKRREERFKLSSNLLEMCSHICKTVEQDPQKQKEWRTFVTSLSGDYDQYVMVQASIYLTQFSTPDPLRRDSFRQSVSRVFQLEYDEDGNEKIADGKDLKGEMVVAQVVPTSKENIAYGSAAEGPTIVPAESKASFEKNMDKEDITV